MSMRLIPNSSPGSAGVCKWCHDLIILLLTGVVILSTQLDYG